MLQSMKQEHTAEHATAKRTHANAIATLEAQHNSKLVNLREDAARDKVRWNVVENHIWHN